MTITRICAIAVFAVVAGCATDTELRNDAQALSVYVEKVKSDGAAFQQARDRVAKARVATLNFLQANALASEQSVQRDIAAREVAQDKQWLGVFDALKKAPEVISKQRQERKDEQAAATEALAKAKGAVDLRTGKLTEASSALAALAEKRSTKDELRFYRDFLNQVKTGLKDKAVDAQAQASDAATASAAKSGVSE
jgi:hypothetical protein